MSTSWTAQATVTASLTAFLYEGFTYNAVFLGRVLPAVHKDDQVVPFLVLFNVVWGLALWSYLRTSWADPGAVPEEWHDFVRRAGPALSIAPGMKEWQPGKATMCRQCTRPRPERAHHCALCGVCILRLDHHCPWINNCVGFSNQKFFLLTCLYALLACLTGFLTTVPELATVTRTMRASLHGQVTGQDALLNVEPSDQIAFLAFGALAIFISMFLAPLLCIQWKLAFNNRTTIEDNYQNMTNPFDLGTSFQNLSQIFGHFGIDWFLPVHPWRPFVDGVTFPRYSEGYGGDSRGLIMNGAMSIDDEGFSLQNGMEDGYDPMLSKTWQPAYGVSREFTDVMHGEAVWRAHYGIALPGDGEPRKPSTLDHIFGCMQLDCEGNETRAGTPKRVL